jgi:hypothetical protein
MIKRHGLMVTGSVLKDKITFEQLTIELAPNFQECW